jgi:hypothetical protein
MWIAQMVVYFKNGCLAIMLRGCSPSQWTWRVIPFLIERNGHFQVVVIAFVGHGHHLQISKELE